MSNELGSAVLTKPAARGQRLFFAFWPDETVRDRLDGLTRHAMQSIEGRRVRRDNLHATLIFLGVVDTGVRDCAERVASSISAQSFTLALDEIGWWRQPRILWVGASQAPSPLLELVALLSAGLEECGVRPERRVYRPHITLARKVSQRPRPAATDSIAWYIDHFVLVESMTLAGGASYRVLRSWGLGAG